MNAAKLCDKWNADAGRWELDGPIVSFPATDPVALHAPRDWRWVRYPGTHGDVGLALSPCGNRRVIVARVSV